MATFSLRVDLGNAAFDDDSGAEVARILRELADDLDHANVRAGLRGHKLRDVNGNTVGEAKVTG